MMMAGCMFVQVVFPNNSELTTIKQSCGDSDYRCFEHARLTASDRSAEDHEVDLSEYSPSAYD